MIAYTLKEQSSYKVMYKPEIYKILIDMQQVQHIVKRHATSLQTSE